MYGEEVSRRRNGPLRSRIRFHVSCIDELVLQRQSDTLPLELFEDGRIQKEGNAKQPLALELPDWRHTIITLLQIA
jgi:hypothetical protein